MKKILLLLMVMIAANSLIAQPPTTPGANGQMKAPPSIGSVIGKLVDGSGKPVANASVMMMSGKMDTVTKKFKEVLLSIHEKPMEEQGNHLGNFIEAWKNGAEQTDDILVIGAKV